MTVTREFARDYVLMLPDGYHREKGADRPKKSRQMSLYDKRQEDLGGLSLEQRKAQVTAAWAGRDTPRAFVRSLEDMGYILSTGNRDYVLVDRYGHMNSLPKLIDDKKVRTKEVRDFLAQDFPKDSLPSVYEARALAAAHRAAMELFGKGEERAAREAKEQQRRDELQRKQQPRRQAVELEKTALTERQSHARHQHSDQQKTDRLEFRHRFLQESQRIKAQRAANRPKGLAEFLGRITGVALITQKVQQFRDAARYREFLTQKKEMAERQQREAAAFERKLALETLTMHRRLRALELVEQRERKSLETSLLKDRRVDERARTERQPEPEPAKTHTDEFNAAAKKPIDLKGEFERASGSAGDGGEAAGGGGQEPAPEAEITIQRRRRARDRSQENDPPTKRSRTERDPEGDNPSGNDPTPPRRRNRDLDRGR